MLRIRNLIILLLVILLNSCELRQAETDLKEIDTQIIDTTVTSESLLIPIQLLIDESLEPLSSRKLSEKFTELLPYGAGAYSVNDTIVSGEKWSVHIPMLLPFNEIVSYTVKSLGTVYEATIKKVNLTDLVCLMTVFEDGIISKQFLDTLTFVPFKYGSSEGTKYGVRLPKHLYVSAKGNIKTHIELDFNSNKRMYYKKSYPRIDVKLETDAFEEPYLIFLDRLISQMGENHYYFMSHKRSNDSISYEKSFVGFKELISDLLVHDKNH